MQQRFDLTEADPEPIEIDMRTPNGNALRIEKKKGIYIMSSIYNEFPPGFQVKDMQYGIISCNVDIENEHFLYYVLNPSAEYLITIEGSPCSIRIRQKRFWDILFS